ncbi:MAG: L-lactate dehydrogenase complex protein LldF [Thermodesulfobacteriota bacterium]|nr:L-lactate dehydrogenase complex protein LldF [Thermodesulfobacteriota bacterium]
MTRPFTFRSSAAVALRDRTLREALGRAVDTALAKRLDALNELADVEDLRDQARSVRLEVVNNLQTYLQRFRTKAQAEGAVVYEAETPESALRLVTDILRKRGLTRIVKAKSMVTEEIDLNEYLLGEGFSVVETDLGEYIVSLAGERPSHLTAPAIHKTRSQIGLLFEEKLGIPYTDNPETLTAIAREKLRGEFLAAHAGITGVNFALADTGSIVLFTNEGNGRMCSVLPRVHIAVMSPEKVIPSLPDLDVFMKLLPRSATGQALTTYLSVITGPREDEEQSEPDELHIVIVDNGRRQIAASEYHEILTCIRCGACMNVCPVYRSVGGHAYGSTYPGPMGIILSILLFGMEKYHSLTDACTLCGACDEVCPVLVPISTLIARLRRARNLAGFVPFSERMGMKSMGAAFQSPRLYRLAQQIVASLHPLMGQKTQSPNLLGRLPTPGNPPFHGRFGR